MVDIERKEKRKGSWERHQQQQRNQPPKQKKNIHARTTMAFGNKRPPTLNGLKNKYKMGWDGKGGHYQRENEWKKALVMMTMVERDSSTPSIAGPLCKRLVAGREGGHGATTTTFSFSQQFIFLWWKWWNKYQGKKNGELGGSKRRQQQQEQQ